MKQIDLLCSMSLQQKFRDFIHTHRLFTKNDELLLAVSGGCDSMVLADLCIESGYRVSIAHCNFQLRGEESMRDQHFVASYAKQKGVPIFLKKMDVEQYAQEHKAGTQAAARELRYRWFRELELPGTGKPFRAVLTAHHADDNIETVLLNIFRGTGVKGLSGMAPTNGQVLRPLLFASQEEIREYAKERKLKFVEDSSNASDKYSRNFIRNTLLPQVAIKFPSIKENMLHTIERFREIEMFYTAAMEEKKKKLLVFQNEEVHIPVLKLQKEPGYKTLFYEILNNYGFTSQQAAEAFKLMHAANSKYIEGATHRIIKNRNWLIMTPVNHQVSEWILIGENEQLINFGGGILKIQPDHGTGITSDAHTACIPASALEFPLLLRRWKDGDYFYPLGMQKKKKLARFLIDLKLSKPEKEKIWVLESAKKIIWVLGYRIDDRFKVKPSSQKITRFLFLSGTS
jgi:tRNA(Ile)-lysidine synthase